MSEQQTDRDTGRDTGRDTDSWVLYAEVLETVSTALLALAFWAGAAALVGVLAAFLVGAWTLAFVLPVGLLGAALSLRSRATYLQERRARGQSLGG